MYPQQDGMTVTVFGVVGTDAGRPVAGVCGSGGPGWHRRFLVRLGTGLVPYTPESQALAQEDNGQSALTVPEL